MKLTRVSSQNLSRQHFLIWKTVAILSTLIIATLSLSIVYLAVSRPNIVNDIATIDKQLKLSESIKSYISIIPKRAGSAFVKLPELNLEISHINVQKLEYMRQNALNGNKNFEYVSAKISNTNKKVTVRLRLKGDRKIHFDTPETSSYRVKVKGEETLFGMKTFSIHKPRARNYVYEWVYLKLMQFEGLMAPNYKYIKLILNGKDLGLFVIEEHYDKYLIERFHMKEGPIIRFKEENTNKDYKFSQKYFDTAIVPYGSDKWSKPENIAATKKSIYLLEAFRQGDLNIDAVFDVEKLATFFAITDLTGTHHGTIPKSIRLYYNTVTSKLEPIPFDGHYGAFSKVILSSEIAISPNNWIYLYWKDWFFDIFNNKKTTSKKFLSAYYNVLNKISKKEYLDNFFSQLGPDLNQALLFEYTETPLKDNINNFGPLVFKFEKKLYYDRALFIRSKFKDATIYAHTNNLKSDHIVLDINRKDRQFPLELLSLDCSDIILLPSKTTLVSHLELNQKEVHQVRFNFDFKNQVSVPNQCKTLKFKTLGSDKIVEVDVYPWQEYDHFYVSNDLSRSPPNHLEFDFISVSDHEKEIIFKSGTHEINSNLIIPEGYKVFVPAGTKIKMNYGVIIYSRSPILAIGSKEKPIIFLAADKFAQGLTVVQAKGLSILDYVVFKDFRSPNQNGWSIPGAINFYESPVYISNTSVLNNKSEDSINIVRSDFKIDRLEVKNSSGDAVDIDFGNGNITNSRFINIGNDAIDISGTKLILEDISINGTTDKGISAGEGSNVTGSNLSCLNSNLCIAAKDMSTVELRNLNIKNSKIAFAAYQKKSEFGPANLKIDELDYDGNGIFSLIEKQSVAYIEGKTLKGDLPDVFNWVESFLQRN